MKRFTAVLAPALAGAAVLAATPAALAFEPHREAVRYDAAELGTQAGRDAVRQRLQAAAESVCPAAGRGVERLERIRCIDAAMADAERQLERRIAAHERSGLIRTAGA